MRRVLQGVVCTAPFAVLWPIESNARYMNIRLRHANTRDAERVAEILIASRFTYMPYAPSVHTDEETKAWVRDVLIPDGGTVLAIVDNAPVGVLATSIDGGFGWVNQLYLAPAFVGKGIGTALLYHALELLPRPVRLWAFQENQGARRFYERHGFSPIEFTDGQCNEERCPDVLYELA